MKEDYLWNKTGSDTNIEAIEKALAVFRFDATKLPSPPVKLVSPPEKPYYRFFKLGLAFAFAASVMLILSLTWLLTPAHRPDIQTGSVNADEPQNISAVDRPDTPPTPPGEPIARKRTATQIKQRSARPAKPVRTVARRIEVRNQPEKLTAEEKYAYNQLMLALSITSSELRIFKDKISGREERNAADDRPKVNR